MNTTFTPCIVIASGGLAIYTDLRGGDPQVAGSEFLGVVIPLATQHYMLLQRNLIYTRITRGKRLLVLIGQKMAPGIAVRNDRPQRRYLGLLNSLRSGNGAMSS
jgi:hypothetical protein